MTPNTNPTAALLIIGNEILSGRTQDTNLNYIAKTLGALGITFAEVRVIPDVEAEIIAAINALRNRYDYLFTTGGIGPTHDDITSAAIAKAFGVNLLRDARAVALLESHYKPEDLNAARLKMAEIPEGAELIQNPVSKAPGFILGNVYVMAGVPRIMQAMLDGVKHSFKTGTPIISRTISVAIGEGSIGETLGQIQAAHPDVEIGSYPFVQDGKIGTSLVMRGYDDARLDAASAAIHALLKEKTASVIEEF